MRRKAERPDMPTLYITDLDGTLLRNDATLSDYSRETLNRLVRDGATFAIASARSMVSIRKVLTGLHLKLPVIDYNGAFISDLATGRHLVTNAIPAEIVPELVATVQRFHCQPLMMTYDGLRDYLYHMPPINEGEHHYISGLTEPMDERLRPLEDMELVFSQQVVCVNLVDRHERLAALQKALHEQFDSQLQSHLFINTYLPGWYWLMIHESAASKDQAIRTLVAREGLGDHELVVFGDNDNDVPMFRIADRAIAVGNATELLKKHATEVIGPNEADSVANYILQDWEKGS